jgi:hypothetical protein
LHGLREYFDDSARAGRTDLATTHAGGRLLALSPLIYAHINPYGRFDLDMDKRIPIEACLEMAN